LLFYFSEKASYSSKALVSTLLDKSVSFFGKLVAPVCLEMFSAALLASLNRELEAVGISGPSLAAEGFNLRPYP